MTYPHLSTSLSTHIKKSRALPLCKVRDLWYRYNFFQTVVGLFTLSLFLIKNSLHKFRKLTAPFEVTS
jgi:hypothetical protein